MVGIPAIGASLGGFAGRVLEDFLLDAEGGSYTLTGTDATLRNAKAIATDPASYLLTGTSATLKHALRLSAAAGSYVLTGTDVTLTGAKLLAAGAGSYTISGAAAALVHALKLAAAAGSYVLTGTDAAATKSNRLSAAAGSYALTGTDPALKAAKKLAAAAGSYALTGTNATLTKATPPMVYSYHGLTNDNSNATTYTFTNVAIGAAGAGRVIAVGVQTRTTSVGTPRNLSSATLAGNAMTLSAAVSNGSSTGQSSIGWFYITEATGTTATITVTFSSGTQNCSIVVYRLFPVSSTPVDADKVAASTPATLSDLEVKTQGLALILVDSGRAGGPALDSYSWTGVDTPVRDLTDDVSLDQTSALSAFSIPTTENDTTRDFTAADSGQVVRIAGISWQ